MGQKINPHILRLGPVYNWESRWFSDKKYKETLFEDYKLRKALMEKLRYSGIARVEIERSNNNVKFIIYVSRPGMVIGRAGTGLEDLKKYVTALFPKKDGKQGKNAPKIDSRVEPVKEPNLDAYLVARNISDQLLKRLPYKRILNQTAERVMGAGAKGVRVVLAGRVGGAEIHRKEKIQVGKVPLSTIREHIAFASFPSLTKKGYVGVKVWINQPETK